jgi:hypothetical protein
MDEHWIAKMRPMTGADLLPSPEQMWADMQERISLIYGSGVVDQLADFLSPERGNALAVLGHALSERSGIEEVMIPDMARSYTADQNVRPNDFNKAVIAQIERDRIKAAIEDQAERKVQLQQEAEASLRKPKAEKKPTVSLDKLLGG